MASKTYADHPNYPYAEHPDFQFQITLMDLPSGQNVGPVVFEGSVGAFLDENVDASMGDFSLEDIEGMMGDLSAHGEALVGMGFKVIKAPEPGAKP